MFDDDFIMVAKRSVDHFGTFAVLLENRSTNLGMTAFHVVVGRFSDVMQEPTTTT